jgi:hypothetical protein
MANSPDAMIAQTDRQQWPHSQMTVADPADSGQPFEVIVIGYYLLLLWLLLLLLLLFGYC